MFFSILLISWTLGSCGRHSLELYSRSRCQELPEDLSHVPWGNHGIALISSAARSLPCVPIAMTAKRPPLNPCTSERNGSPAVQLHLRSAQAAVPSSERERPAPDSKHREMCPCCRLAEGESRSALPKESLGTLVPSTRGISREVSSRGGFDMCFDVCLQFWVPFLSPHFWDERFLPEGIFVSCCTGFTCCIWKRASCRAPLAAAPAGLHFLQGMQCGHLMDEVAPGIHLINSEAPCPRPFLCNKGPALCKVTGEQQDTAGPSSLQRPPSPGSTLH